MPKSTRKKRGLRTKSKINYNQQRQSKKEEPKGNPKNVHDAKTSAKTSGSGIETMKRGRKRKNVRTEKAKEIQIPSSAVLPARLLSAIPQRIPQTTLPVIKKEVDTSPVIKMPKTDSIPLDTGKTFENTDVENIRNLTSKCQEFPAGFEPMPQTTDSANIGTNNELSFSHGSSNLLNVKSEPVSPVACAANCTFEDSNYCEQNVENLDLIKIKCEPRSRSSSTETVVNEESLQLPLAECQSDTFAKSSSVICQVTNVAHSSLGSGENSVLPLSKESIHPSFVVPIHSPNISFSQHRNSAMQKLISNIPFVTKLFKYNNFNAEIAKADAKDCLNYLTFLYPLNRSFSLFFSNDTYLRQRENLAVEPSESIPIISSTPTVTEVISTDELKKIIKFTSSLLSSNSSNLSLPLQNTENNNIVKDPKNMNTLSLSGSISQLPIVCSTLEKESDRILNPRIKKEPICNEPNESSGISPSVSTSGKRSAEESSTEMHGLSKKIKTSPDRSLVATEYTIETQIKPGYSTEKYVSIDTSKGNIQNQSLENARIVSNTLKCCALTLPNSFSGKNTASDNMLPNNANMSHVSSVSDSKNSTATDSIVSKATTSKFTSYLHLLPQEIHKDVSSTDVAPETNLRTIFPVEPSTSVSSNYTVVTTVSDSIITKSNISYSQKIPVIKRLSTCATQLVEKANLGDDKNSSDYNNPFACNKINNFNPSQPGINFCNNVKTKKKISPEIYFRRKSSPHFHDPCTQMYTGQKSVSQISSPELPVEPYIASVANQQSPNRSPIAYIQNAHQFNKSSFAPRFEIASNVQQKSFQNSASSQSIFVATPAETPQRSVTPRNQTQIIAGNCSVSHHSLRRSREFLPSTSRDPRKTKSYYQKLFGSPRQNFSSILRRDTAGNKFIETKDLPYIILSWNVSWLSIQKEALMTPPIWDNYLSVKDTYQCVQQYYDTFQPLHLLNIWFDIYQGWERSQQSCYNGVLIEVRREEEFVNMSITVKLNATDRSNCLKKEDILICTSSSAGSTQKLFGRIVDLVERNWNPPPDPFHFEKPVVYKQLYLEIMCAESFTVQPPAVVHLQYLTNISVALKKNDALKYTNPAMRAMVLNPSENERLLQTTTVPPIKNVTGMMHSVRSLEHRVTIINTSTSSISVTTILQVVLLLKTDSILLVGVKDRGTFVDLALKMKNLNLVLAIREDEVPSELQTFTVNYCDSANLKSCQVVLTLIPSMFLGEIESRLKTESIICIIHEAQCFFETETALLLAYKVEHLILTGRPDVKASTPPKLGRYSFDVSLFHRILRKR